MIVATAKVHSVYREIVAFAQATTNRRRVRRLAINDNTTVILINSPVDAISTLPTRSMDMDGRIVCRSVRLRAKDRRTPITRDYARTNNFVETRHLLQRLTLNIVAQDKCR